MPFIGKQPAHGNRTLLDSITTSATATYNLQKSSASFTAASAESLIVSLNGVIQAPISAYTLASNNTQIVFASALTSNDVIDFIISVSDAALPIGTPSDSTVTSAKLVDGNVTVDKLAAGTLKTPGSNNLAIGTDALVDGSLSGTHNLGVGPNALKENEDGAYNTAIGYNSMPAATGADYNTGLGYGTLYTTSTGQYNLGAGHQALWLNTTGNYNVALGAVAAYDNTEGHYGTAVGYATLYNNIDGDYNTAVGVQAGYSNTTGYNQVFLGGYAGYAATDGNSNVCVGYTSGYGITTGDNNITIGSSAGRANSPSGNITTGDNIICLGNNSITDIYCADTSISSSDERDKADITDFTHGLSWVLKMRPVTYKWDKRSDYLDEDDEEQDITKVTRDGSKKKSKVNVGLIAQEVLAIEQADSFSSSKDNMLVVNLNEDNTGYGIKYERIVPVLINAIKELEARIKVLED